MTNKLVKLNDVKAAVHLSAAALELAGERWAESTRRAYQRDWRQFRTWCWIAGQSAMPALPETVANYLALLAGRYKAASIGRKLAAISTAHEVAGADFNPCKSRSVRDVMTGIRRRLGVAPEHRKDAMLIEHLAKALPAEPQTLREARDKALLLIGHAGGFRRSELVALDVADLSFSDEGVLVTVRRSKTDQEGEGHVKEITRHPGADNCPVRALETWLDMAKSLIPDIFDGPLFRRIRKADKLQSTRLSDKAVALIVKRYAEAAGLDADKLAGHSLRAGFVTDCCAAEISDAAIIAQTGHKTTVMLSRYRREARRFKNSATRKLDY